MKFDGGGRMKALVLESYGNPVIREMPVPECANDSVLIRVHACAICGSDLHGYDGRSDRRRPPIIMGHEAAGEIVQIGKDVKDYKVDDRVVFNSSLFCGKCWYCMHGQQNLCESSRVFGVHCADYKLDGAMAEYVCVPERILYHMPQGLSFSQAALVEPLSIGLHAVNRTPIGMNESALVIGTGAIGLMLIKALKQTACNHIVAVDISDDRLAHARTAGADETVNSQCADADAKLRALFPKGADHTFEAVGAGMTVNNALEYVKRGGTVTLVGNAVPSAQIDIQKVVLKELNVIGTYACANEYALALELLGSGKLNCDDLISVEVPLEDGKKWLDALKTGGVDVVKVVLTI